MTSRSTAAVQALSGAVPGAAIHIDGHYALLNGAFRMDYRVLRSYVEEEARVCRAVIYTAYDPLRALSEAGYRTGFRRFKFFAAKNGFEVFEKIPKAKTRGGHTFDEADCDGPISGDMVLDAWKLGLRRVVLVSGDGDYVPTILGLKRQGVFVEVIGFRSVNWLLKRSASRYMSGYRIKGLVTAIDPPNAADQEDGSVCNPQSAA